MKKTTPTKYFVGKFKDKDGDADYREMRRITKGRGIFAKRVDEMRLASGWVKPKKPFVQASNLFNSREAMRVEKRKSEGKR